MSRTQERDQDEPLQLPDKVVTSPDTDGIHRQGSGIEPACIARYPDSDAEWRLARRVSADGERCGHPECFGGLDDV